ncbi:MAG: hypothetical protein WCI74_03740 [Actinomycetes bacterium]
MPAGAGGGCLPDFKLALDFGHGKWMTVPTAVAGVMVADMRIRGAAMGRVVGFGLGLALVGGAVAAPVSASATVTATGSAAASGVRSVRGDVPAFSASIWRAYRRAIIDATVATPKEVAQNLIAITAGDPRLEWRTIDGADYVLVSTIRRDALGVPGQRVSLTSDRWVSIPNQVENYCRRARCSKLSAKKLDLRVKQMIGLPPDGDYTYVNSLWVRPADVFRPCPDPRITTHSCPVQVPSGGVNPAVVGSTNLASFLWIQANYAWRMPDTFAGSASFSCAVMWADPNCYGLPWTRLGYSYDWKPGAKEQGPSEFVAVRGASVVIESVKTLSQTFK